ncbi:diguanylate cyclase [Paraburkholderia sp. JHI2823]|uniref:diguanylate cyclase n=1 Tax=Paraburkholderia sp. JHI2823 TaxID=3112960 RepID=UPI003177361B
MELTLLALQDVMLTAMTGNLPLADTMYALCSEVQRIAPELVVSALRLDGTRCRPLAAPGLPLSYDEAVNGVPIGPDVGSCGSAMFYGDAVLTRDIEEDPKWRTLKHLVKPLGLRACWSHPIKHRNGRVLGSLAFYFREPCEPNGFHAKLAEVCLRLCTLAFEYEETHDSLQRLAYFDTLTTLPNRGMLEREASRIVAEARMAGSSVAVLMLDVDHFKQYNDTHGHPVGDRALRLIASRIAEGVARPGDIAGRYGGEEFCVVLQGAGHVEAAEVAESIRRAVESGYSDDLAHPWDGLTISVGIAVFDGHPDDSFEKLIERADRCLYEAKRTGRNRVVGPRQTDGPQGSPASTPRTVNPEVAGAGEPEDVSHLYGDDLAPLMTALTVALKPGIGTLVEAFHEHLATLADAGETMRSLSGQERSRLKQQHIGNLMMLASPNLRLARHRAACLKLGRIHAIFGLSRRDLSHSHEVLHSLLMRHVDAAAHQVSLATLSRRLSRDLTWQIEASRIVWETLQDVLRRITELAWSARSHAELIGKAASIIGALDGCVGCSFGRPDIGGHFRFEAVCGVPLQAYLADLEASASSQITNGGIALGQGPTGRAWTTGRVERCINFETDQRVDPWRAVARRYSIRSSVAIPLCPPNQTPGTILTLYSELPGGYSSPEQTAFVRQLQALLTFAVVRLEGWRPRVEQALPWSTRQRWASLIGTSALEMHYQPIRDLVSGSVARAEALVRLRDGGELLAPGSFFPSLSREDFVVVYAQGLHQVLDQQNRWLREGIDVQVSVNLPADALSDSRYYEITREALRQQGCHPQRLMLEVLETSDAVPDDGGQRGLEKFRALGVRLAEDDLGSGHSGLDRLCKLPFDVIKLDRSLLLGIERTPVDVLSSIYQLTNLCHALGKSVVVEGVESADLIDAVALLGADAVQGYAIARPMPAAQFTDWMRIHADAYRPAGPADPSGRFARLAKLLIWDSHLHLLFGPAQSRVYEFATTRRPVLPFTSISAALQTSLLDAAMRHGISGPEYRAARERLIAALSGE